MNRSLDEYNRFLAWARDKALIKPVTVTNWITASRLVFEILEDHEKMDVGSIDLDSVMTRFHNRHHQKYHPKSVNDYKVRLATALREFTTYAENPSQYKPMVSTRFSPKKQNKSDQKKNGVGGEQSTETNYSSQQSSFSETPGQTNLKISVPVPIRPGIIIEIRNLPSDLTSSEAEKISAVVKAFSIPKE